MFEYVYNTFIAALKSPNWNGLHTGKIATCEIHVHRYFFMWSKFYTDDLKKQGDVSLCRLLYRFSSGAGGGRPPPNPPCSADHPYLGHSSPKPRPASPTQVRRPWRFPQHLHLLNRKFNKNLFKKKSKGWRQLS